MKSRSAGTFIECAGGFFLSNLLSFLTPTGYESEIFGTSLLNASVIPARTKAMAPMLTL